jgi:DnaK suppressor protein
MTDEIDHAEMIERITRETAIERITNRPVEWPEFDEHGERVCVDCGEHIPHPRIEAVNAIRCVPCQEAVER